MQTLFSPLHINLKPYADLTRFTYILCFLQVLSEVLMRFDLCMHISSILRGGGFLANALE